MYGTNIIVFIIIKILLIQNLFCINKMKLLENIYLLVCN